MIELKFIPYTLAIIFGFYIINHIFRLVSHIKYCAKCGALFLTIILTKYLNFPIQIIYLLLGSLIAILTYYIDDYLLKKKINVIAQDFIILVMFLFVALMAMIW